MRSNNPIKVIMKIPFPISKSDRNGTIYTKEAVEKAVQKYNNGAPLMMIKDEIGTVIGHIEQLELSDDCEVIAHGFCYFGETNEQGVIDNNIVSNFDFISFGISEK